MGHTGAAIAGGQAPDQATNSHWAGAGNHKRTSPAEDTKSVSIRVTLAVTGLQPSSNHQTADWILTVSIGPSPTPLACRVQRRLAATAPQPRDHSFGVGGEPAAATRS